MVEVFRTNVTDPDDARKVLVTIETAFKNYKINFDLQDCDRILRVESAEGSIDSSMIVDLLADCGFVAQILSDDLPEVLNLNL